MHKPRNEGLSKKTGTESVKEMLEEFKEMNDGNEKETRKRRGKQAGMKVAKKRKMGEEGNKRKLVQNRDCTKYIQVIRDEKVKKLMDKGGRG